MVRRYIVKRNNDVNKKIILNNYLNLYSNMGVFLCPKTYNNTTVYCS